MQRVASVLYRPPADLLVCVQPRTPHDVPVAIVGSTNEVRLLGKELHRVQASGFEVRRSPSISAATAEVRDRKVAAAYIVGKFGRLAHHPRQEAHRLHDVADVGESASAPFIEIGAIARWVLPFVLLMIGIVLGSYRAIR